MFRKWTNSNSNSSSTSSTLPPQSVVAANVVTQPAPESPTVDVSSQNAEMTDGEWTYDPNEPRYCLCNQVSYGDMVACDNEDVNLNGKLVGNCFYMIVVVLVSF